MDNTQIRACLARVERGDKTALAELYEGLKTPLYTVILRITHSRELSEDLLHDLFVKLYQAPPGAAVKNPRAYLFQMARNLSLNSLRTPQTAALDEASTDGGDVLAETVSLQLDAADALEKLPQDEREIVCLHLNGELKFREIAELLQMPLGTALWKYRSALSKLRIYFSEGKG